MVNKKTGSKHLTLKESLVVSRPFWWVNTAAPFVASYFIINGLHDWTLVLGVLYFTYVYNLAMYGINDIFDYESDIRNPRKTGIDGSVLSKDKHPMLWWYIALTSIPLLIYLFVVGSWQANLWLAIMVCMVLAYSVKGVRFKEIPFLDSATSSFHYTSPFIYGGLLAASSQLYWPAYIIFFIWVAANHAFGAIQDITPDREAGIDSIATKLGAARTIILVLGLYALAALLPVVFYGLNGLLASVLLAPYVVIVARTLKNRDNDQSPLFRKGWKQFLYVNYAVGFVFTWILLIGFNIV
jgi:4-hydroxybenzoate polyprenyltransferase